MHYDMDGNGIDDDTGMPYGHGFGWMDENHDGINDLFTDTDGDGVNDLTGYHYGNGFMHNGSGMDGGSGGSGMDGGSGGMMQ